MGNLSFIVPTKNKENFNIKFIKNLIKNELGFKIEEYSEFNQLSVKTDFIYKNWLNIQKIKKSVTICDIFFNQECYLLNFEKDLYFLKNIMIKNERYEQFFFDLKELQKQNPDLNECLKITYGVGFTFKERNRILNLLKNYFFAYIFDEGIHPEFMSPNYKFKEENL